MSERAAGAGGTFLERGKAAAMDTARADAPQPEAAPFGALLRQYRLAAGLSQEELAERAGLSVQGLSALENGRRQTPYRHTVALLAEALGLSASQAALLEAAVARRRARALKSPGSSRLERDAGRHPQPDTVRHSAEARGLPAPERATYETVAWQVAAAVPPQRHDWGDAPAAPELWGRATELATLARWVGEERCRVVAVLGIGGIGKTAVAARLAHDLAPAFASVYWRSLRNALPVAEWLAGAIAALSAGQALPPEGLEARLGLLLDLLRAQRGLLVLDNLETVLEPGAPEVCYRAGYEGYGAVLQLLGASDHQGCLLLTSREKPLREDNAAVRTLRLEGLTVDEGRALLGRQALAGDGAAWRALVERYAGNPLALHVVGETIRTVFGGDIAAFLAQDVAVFGGIRQLLDEQVARLSALERALLLWLAVEREPVSFADLAADLGVGAVRGEVVEAVEALQRRSLLERGAGGMFTLQPVVLEYVTAQMVARVCAEVLAGAPALLVRYALVKAPAKDYVRRSQERLIAQPLLEQVTGSLGSAAAVEQRLQALLQAWRGRGRAEQGYGPGNVVNLLRLLRGDLRRLDLSGLAIRHAYLAGIEAQDASLAGAHLSEAVLAGSFTYPIPVALSADGVYLAAGTSAGEVCVWRVANRTLLLAVQGHAGPILGVALSGDGRLAASGSFDRTVRVWEVASGRLLSTLQGHSSGVWGVALSGDGGLAASSSFDGTVKLWEAESGLPLATLRGHIGGVQGVALSRDGGLVASGSQDGTVKLWEAQSGRLLATLQGHSGVVFGVALSGDGRLVASGGFDRTVRVWEVPSGRLLATLQGHAGGVWGVALSGDGRLAASGSFDRTVRVWEVASGRLWATLQGHSSGVWGVALSGDGQLAASASQDGTVKLWDAPSGQLQATLQGYTGAVQGVALSGDGRLVASGSFDGTVKLWEAESGRLLDTLHGHNGVVWGVTLSVDGQLVVSGSADGTVKLWEAPSGRLRATLQGHSGGVTGVALSGDGQLVTSGSFDGTVRLWEAESGRLRATLRGHTGQLYNVALSGDGRLVASASQDGTVKLWEAPSGRLRATLQGHTGEVVGVALSRDGRLVASGSQDGTVKLWEAENGRLLATLQGHTGWVRGVTLSEDGRLVVSGSFDGTVKLWDASSGACLRTLRGDRCYERLDITGLTGVTEAQRAALVALGAVERPDRHISSRLGPARTVSSRGMRHNRRGNASRLGDSAEPPEHAPHRTRHHDRHEVNGVEPVSNERTHGGDP